jgi:hypothetical protein
MMRLVAEKHPGIGCAAFQMAGPLNIGGVATCQLERQTNSPFVKRSHTYAPLIFWLEWGR